MDLGLLGFSLLLSQVNAPSLYSCNEGPIPQFTLLLPKLAYTVVPGDFKVVLATDGYLGLEFGGYQRVQLTTMFSKKAVTMTLPLRATEALTDSSKIILESSSANVQEGQTYNISVHYSESRMPNQCHPERDQDLGSFYVKRISNANR